MIITYIACLTLGWGLLLFDYLWNRGHKVHDQEPYRNDAVVIGGASAVLSPIIQWGHTILNSRRTRKVGATCMCPCSSAGDHAVLKQPSLMY